MSASEFTINEMKKCGFWQRHNLDRLPQLVESLATIHAVGCRDESHLIELPATKAVSQSGGVA